MEAAIAHNEYILRRQGSMRGGKYLLFGLNSDVPLLFIEEQTGRVTTASTTYVYLDEAKGQEVLRLTESEVEDIEMEVVDPASGSKIGAFGLVADALGEYLADEWVVTDAGGEPIGKLLDKSVSSPAGSERRGGEPPQKMDLVVGGAIVGELRQKVRMAGYELVADFTMDVAHLLDRRLGIAAAIFAALQQARGG